MDETNNLLGYNERINKEAPHLVKLLKEMKEGLDTVRSKVEALTVKVKADNFPTADGISYLEAKHLLLLNYCQSLVYYLLRKAKGFSIEGHPVLRSLVEIRLFLEKVRPIDKKLQYQIQKLTRVPDSSMEKASLSEKEVDASQEPEDFLKYHPNPDHLVSKASKLAEDGDGVYRPPKFAPASMEEDKTSKQEKNATRKEIHALRQARQSQYVRELLDDHEGRPEEVIGTFGAESRELLKYREKLEERARREEEQFTRAPLTKVEKKKHKKMSSSRNGLQGLTDSFFDEIKTLPMEDTKGGAMTGFENGGGGDRKFKKHKRKH
ncbi:hypothetical protein LguiB_028098 [Lonicera macranthoides]